MTFLPLKICERNDYDDQTNFLKSTVNRLCELPENPFFGTGLTYRFDEFDWTLSGEFWQTVQSLSSRSMDNEVLMAVLDPDPVGYFKAHFGCYGWARLTVAMTKQEYWEFVDQSPADSPADSILAVAEKITWVPPSKTWCIWAERESGLCVIASSLSHFGDYSKGVKWAVDWCRPWATAAYLEQLKLNFGDP